MNTFFQKLIANDNCYSSFRYVIEDQKKSYQTNNRIDFLLYAVTTHVQNGRHTLQRKGA